MQPSENVRTLFDEAQQKRGDDENAIERLVAERESVTRETKSRSPLPKILTFLVLLALIGGGGVYANRYSFVHGQALQTLTSKLSDLEGRVAGLLSASADEHSRSEASLSELRNTDNEIKKSVDAFTADFNDLKSTVGKNSSAIQAIDAKLEAAKAAAKKVRQVTVAKAQPKLLEEITPSPDQKNIFPEFALVSIDTFAYQNFAVVRSPGRGLVDLGTADSLDGWRVVEFDITGQRVAFESRSGVLRWLTTQP